LAPISAALLNFTNRKEADRFPGQPLLQDSDRFFREPAFWREQMQRKLLGLKQAHRAHRKAELAK
jgi:hypothetical protein